MELIILTKLLQRLIETNCASYTLKLAKMVEFDLSLLKRFLTETCFKSILECNIEQTPLELMKSMKVNDVSNYE